MMNLKIATRKSRLALWQTAYVTAQLELHYADLEVELVCTATTGDQVTDRALADIGGKALFVKDLEQKLLSCEADIAIHSLKDVPADLDKQFALICFLPRASAFDALIAKDHATLDSLPDNAIIGTSSPRRQAQLKLYRPDLQIKLLRGNVETRLKKWQAGQYDAIVLAEAGLQRLDLQNCITQVLPSDICLSAAGQGIIAVETLAGRLDLERLLQPLNNIAAQICAIAEQSMVYHLHGNCHSPIGAYATVTGNSVHLKGRVLDLAGTTMVEAEQAADIDKAMTLGQHVAQLLKQQGATRLLS